MQNAGKKIAAKTQALTQTIFINNKNQRMLSTTKTNRTSEGVDGKIS